ncbi:hypothetical protein ACP4OV_021208 [Aristida adscensionis]
MALVLGAAGPLNLLDCGTQKLLLEPKPKENPNRELTWEEKAVKVLGICAEHLPAYSPKEPMHSSGGISEAGDADVSCAVEVGDGDTAVLKRGLERSASQSSHERRSRVELGPPLSKLGPSDWVDLEASVNVISFKIVESDEGYPIRVFGTIIARDVLDYKCIYLFRRDKENPQVINSPNDILTLTGPYRGLAVTDSMFFEINLRTIDDAGDRVLSKGVIEHNALRHTKKTMSWLLTSWLSTVELVYAPVQFAVEAKLAVSILEGPCNFTGKVIAWTTENHENHIILYDSEAVIGEGGSVQLSRCVVAVPLGEKLMLDIAACAAGESFKLTLGQYDQKCMFKVGPYELQVKITWTSNLVSRRQNVFTNFEGILLLR